MIFNIIKQNTRIIPVGWKNSRTVSVKQLRVRNHGRCRLTRLGVARYRRQIKRSAEPDTAAPILDAAHHTTDQAYFDAMAMRRTVRQNPLDDARSQFSTCLILLLNYIDPQSNANIGPICTISLDHNMAWSCRGILPREATDLNLTEISGISANERSRKHIL